MTLHPSPFRLQALSLVDLEARRTTEVLPIIRAAIFTHNSPSASLPVAYPRHDSVPFGVPNDPSHWTRAFLGLQATHSPAAHTVDGFIMPHVEHLHSPDPPQCQQVAVAAIRAGIAAESDRRFRSTSKMAGFTSRTRASNTSSRARLGFRQRMSPSTVTLTPRPRSSVKISAAWLISVPRHHPRRHQRCSHP